MYTTGKACLWRVPFAADSSSQQVHLQQWQWAGMHRQTRSAQKGASVVKSRVLGANASSTQLLPNSRRLYRHPSLDAARTGAGGGTVLVDLARRWVRLG